MDKVVKVSTSLLRDVRGFLNCFAGRCHGCLRSSPYNCAECTGYDF